MKYASLFGGDSNLFGGVKESTWQEKERIWRDKGIYLAGKELIWREHTLQINYIGCFCSHRNSFGAKAGSIWREAPEAIFGGFHMVVCGEVQKAR